MRWCHRNWCILCTVVSIKWLGSSSQQTLEIRERTTGWTCADPDNRGGRCGTHPHQPPSRFNGMLVTGVVWRRVYCLLPIINLFHWQIVIPLGPNIYTAMYGQRREMFVHLKRNASKYDHESRVMKVIRFAHSHMHFQHVKKPHTVGGNVTSKVQENR